MVLMRDEQVDISMFDTLETPEKEEFHPMTALETLKRFRMARLLVAAAALVFGLATPATAAPEVEKVVGPGECAECHKDETAVWNGTHHFSTYRDMPRSNKAREIADKLGIKRMKGEALCLNCHFTTKIDKGKEKQIAGISCESCHSASKDWVKVHSEFSGKKKETESAAEAAARWALAEEKGMIRPKLIYLLAKNCYSCHVVPQEKLVNVGGHPAGSKFDLVSWSQGEVRHNSWYSKGVNKQASTERKRMLYVMGLVVELETALRGVGKATKKANYAKLMAKRANTARKKVAALAKLLPDVKELAAIAKLSKSAGLKLNNDESLTKAADGISVEALSLSMNYDGSTFGALDKYVPGPDKYKGKPAK